MNENIERLSELVRKPQLTMIGAPPTINALAFAVQLFGGDVNKYYPGFHFVSVDSFENIEKEEPVIFELQNVFAFEHETEDASSIPICTEAREYDYSMYMMKWKLVRKNKNPVIVLADFTKNAYNAPAELSSFTGNARLVYTADAVLAMQRFQNAIRVSCLKAPWNDYAAWKEPLVDFFVEYDPESQTFHEVPAPEITPLEDLSRINTRKRSARK